MQAYLEESPTMLSDASSQVRVQDAAGLSIVLPHQAPANVGLGTSYSFGFLTMLHNEQST